MARRKHWIAACSALVLATGMLTGCEDKITPENYALIKPGMPIGDVEKLLGEGEREEVSGISISGAAVAGGSSTSVVYTWKADDGRKIVVTVKDGNVSSMNKFGF